MSRMDCHAVARTGRLDVTATEDRDQVHVRMYRDRGATANTDGGNRAGWAPADLSARLAAGDTVVIRLPARGVTWPGWLRDLVAAGQLARVARPSRWGNPHRLPAGADETERADAISRYRAYLTTRPDLLAQLPDLRGKALGCHCAPAACHADVLADLANHR